MVYREYTPFFMENSVSRGINRLNHLLVFIRPKARRRTFDLSVPPVPRAACQLN